MKTENCAMLETATYKNHLKFLPKCSQSFSLSVLKLIISFIIYRIRLSVSEYLHSTTAHSVNSWDPLSSSLYSHFYPSQPLYYCLRCEHWLVFFRFSRINCSFLEIYIDWCFSFWVCYQFWIQSWNFATNIEVSYLICTTRRLCNKMKVHYSVCLNKG